MILYFNNTELDIPVDDNSYRDRRIKGDHILNLYFSLPEHIEIPVGAWAVYEGERYELLRPENFKKHSTRNFEYNLILEVDQGRTRRYIVRDPNTNRVKFDLTAKPIEHARMLVANLNMRESGWTVGECVDAVEKLIPYNHTKCWQALDDIASAFETEWEIRGKQISFKKVEYNKNNPLPLSYGKGNGFKPGLGRSNFDNSGPVEVLLVQGGSKNIDPNQYGGNKELLLPINQTYVYQGRTYATDSDGITIRRTDVAPNTREEGSLDCSHIYPKRVGTVTAVEVIDKDNNFYDIIDDGITFDYSEYFIPGEEVTIEFQEGMLASKPFEVQYVHEEKRFRIVPQEYDGVLMPDENFKPFVGQKYVIFGMMMPDEYICDNQSKSGASWEMFKEAVRYKYEHEDPRFTFTGELDGIWAKKDWVNIGGRIILGGFVNFSDTQFQPEGILIRIVGIKDYINNPQSPIIELSNSTVGGSFNSEIGKIEGDEVINENQFIAAKDFTKRRWRSLAETSAMLQKAIDGFTAEINPIAISTMHIKVGSEQLQFRFVNSRTSPGEFLPDFVMDNTAKVFRVTHRYSPAYLQHMTLGISSLSTTHATSEYLFWQMSDFTSAFLGNDSSPYYLYAKCSKTASTGGYYLSLEPIKMNNTDGYYYFLVGVLNSEWEDYREFEACYGFTEILPGRMTINLIKSTDGRTYFNLAEGEIGGNIKFITGSGGYNSVASQFEIVAGQITSTVEEVRNGQKLVSYINQTAGSITINANRINLQGAVTFNSLDSNLQGTLNGKVDSSKLGNMAFEDAVEYAKLGSTIIIGGYLNTDLIKVRRIEAISGWVGGFTLSNNNLTWSQYDYFGNGSRTIRMGLASDSGGAVDITFNAATSGAYGIKVVGAASGGAAIYASTTSSGTTPAVGAAYAGYFHGGVHVQGNIYTSGRVLSKGFGYITSQNGGSYNYYDGIDFDTNIDLDKYRFRVRGGIIVQLVRE